MKPILSIITVFLLFTSCNKKSENTNINDTSGNSIFVAFKINGQKKMIIPDKINSMVAVSDMGTVGERALMITDFSNDYGFLLSEFDSTALKFKANMTNLTDGTCIINILKDANGTYDGTFSATFIDSTIVTEGVFQNISRY